MPGSLKNKAFGVVLMLLAGYFVITEPTGSAHAVVAVVKALREFLGAL